MARTAEQIQADIDAAMASLGEGVSQIRFPDGSQVTTDMASAQARVRMLREELASIGGVPVRQRMRFIRTRTCRE